MTVLTNSLAATDVAAVHAGYQRYRKPLLEADVQLYELKPAATGSGTADRKKSVFGSSKSSLHAKTYVFGRKGVFIGSMNFDPRSVELNTEIGVYCESDRAAGQVTDHVESNAIGPVMSRIRAPVCEHAVSALEVARKAASWSLFSQPNSSPARGTWLALSPRRLRRPVPR